MGASLQQSLVSGVGLGAGSALGRALVDRLLGDGASGAAAATPCRQREFERCMAELDELAACKHRAEELCSSPAGKAPGKSAPRGAASLRACRRRVRQTVG